MPRTRDLVIFVPMTMTMMIDKAIALSLTHVRRVIIEQSPIVIHYSIFTYLFICLGTVLGLVLPYLLLRE